MSPRILILPLDYSSTATRWSVTSHRPRKQATVYARHSKEARLLAGCLLNVAPDALIAVDSPPCLDGNGRA